MPRGKGTYGSKVGRPSKKKKMTGGGSSKAAKPMAKTVYKKGGAKKKKLKKYQTAGPKTEFMDAISNVNFAPFKSEADQFATKLDQIDPVDRQIMNSMMQNKAANRNAEMQEVARQQQMDEMRRARRDSLRGRDEFDFRERKQTSGFPEIDPGMYQQNLRDMQQSMDRINTPPPSLRGTQERSRPIPGPTVMKIGGLVTNAKDLRNNSRGKARKNK